jgi:hypothetical protein
MRPAPAAYQPNDQPARNPPASTIPCTPIGCLGFSRGRKMIDALFQDACSELKSPPPVCLPGGLQTDGTHLPRAIAPAPRGLTFGTVLSLGNHAVRPELRRTPGNLLRGRKCIRRSVGPLGIPRILPSVLQRLRRDGVASGICTICGCACCGIGAGGPRVNCLYCHLHSPLLLLLSTLCHSKTHDC